MSEKSGVPYWHEVNCACTACMPEYTMKYDWDNPHKVNHSKYWILNKIGNLCELIARPFMSLYYKWGTFWTLEEIDMTEEIDRAGDE